MQWDLGTQALAYLAAMSIVFGLLAGLLVGGDLVRRLWSTAGTSVACFGVGLLVSEWMFGWATEEDLQPNIDGLSRDEALLAGVLTTAIVVLGVRYVARRRSATAPAAGKHLLGRHHGRHAGHA